MPKGKRYTVSGLLGRAPSGYKLEMEGGGFWELDISANVEKLIGKNVTVEGARMGFNLIFVDKLWFEGKKLSLGTSMRVERWFLCSVTMFSLLAYWL